MVLRNCSKSPSGKHAPAGTTIKGTYILGIFIGVIIGIIELFKYLNIHEKIKYLFEYFKIYLIKNIKKQNRRLTSL
ncbi:MAG: hypothetical protein LBC76_01920 [Treponema sp.]|jgi:hypothetical protein|nr:hypothetical protein [Treponema sp.]